MQKLEKLCPYDQCYLPNNNSKYFAQGIYLIISTMYLFKSQEEFTFFAILLYTVPIFLDILTVEFRARFYKVIARIYVVLNVALVIFCVLGMSGLFVDGGESFLVVDTAMFLSEAAISKRMLIWPMAANIFIPFLMYNGCPCKQTKWILEGRKETTT